MCSDIICISYWYLIVFFKQKTAYEMRISDWSSDVCSSDLCHNFIHGNEGMPKDAAFWQFLYLIFCKMHDENLRAKQRQAWQRRFWAGPKEQFEAGGRDRKSVV